MSADYGVRVHLLFSYGTLRLPEVQRTLFGRLVPCEEDALPGYRVDYVTITDPEVLAASGSDQHPILVPGAPADAVPGVCLELNDEDLAAADRYEVDDYARVLVELSSGRQAWVYVSADQAQTSD